jgi:hypothetical protein
VPSIDDKTFTSEGVTTVHRLRRALAELLASVGADPSAPQELARRFKLDKTLTWRISRVIREEDAWEAVTHVPGKPSIRALVERLEAAGASPASVTAVLDAMAAFERFVEVHSGDRETLDIMVGAANRPSAAKRMELFRKQGFQANGAAWGVQARVQFTCHLLMPGAAADTVETATVVGLVDLRRLRSNVPWAMGSAEAWADDHPEVDAGPVPLFPEDVADGAPLIREFCSESLPTLRTRTSPGGGRRYELSGGVLGQTGAATVVLGWRWTRPESIFSSGLEDTGEHGSHLSTPVELFVHDLLVHHSLSFAHHPTAAIYSALPGGPRYPADGPKVGLMPIPDDVVSLGAQPPNVTTIEIPRYAALVDRIVSRLGHSLHEFHGFRHRVRYPTIPTFAIMRHGLVPRSTV